MSTVALDHKSKVTIIMGPQGSGKTTLARMLANRIRNEGDYGEYNICIVDPVNFKEPHVPHGKEFAQLFKTPFTPFNSETKVVVIEDMNLNLERMKDINEIICSDKIKVTHRSKDPFHIPTPHFILTINTKKASYFKNYVETLDLRHFQLISLD